MSKSPDSLGNKIRIKYNSGCWYNDDNKNKQLLYELDFDLGDRSEYVFIEFGKLISEFFQRSPTVSEVIQLLEVYPLLKNSDKTNIDYYFHLDNEDTRLELLRRCKEDMHEGDVLYGYHRYNLLGRYYCFNEGIEEYGGYIRMCWGT